MKEVHEVSTILVEHTSGPMNGHTEEIERHAIIIGAVAAYGETEKDARRLMRLRLHTVQ